jgi:basic membrane protein A and related proteins
MAIQSMGGRLMRVLAFLAVAALAVAGCTAADDAPAEPEATGVDEPTDGEPADGEPADGEPADGEPADGDGDETAADGESLEDLRVAALFPGAITDADYNTLGYLALEALRDDHGAEVAHSENVPVPDAQRVMREYADQGFNVVWTHGGQFYDDTVELAEEFPDVAFVAEFDAEPESIPDNLWVIDRNFHIGFYPMGALAARLSQTGRIGYVGGLSLPFSYSEVHAMRQAIDDLGIDVELVPVWTGDFNDPAAGRQVASQLFGQTVDVLVGSLNLGMVGVFEAAKAEPAGEAWVTAKYTDKSDFAPEHYVTSVLYDFIGPMEDLAQRIAAGERSGYYPLGFETGVDLQFPLQNVPDDVGSEIQDIVDRVRSGDIEVVKDTSPIG